MSAIKVVLEPGSFQAIDYVSGRTIYTFKLPTNVYIGLIRAVIKTLDRGKYNHHLTVPDDLCTNCWQRPRTSRTAKYCAVCAAEAAARNKAIQGNIRDTIFLGAAP